MSAGIKCVPRWLYVVTRTWNSAVPIAGLSWGFHLHLRRGLPCPPDIYVSSEDLNSSPPSCMASTLTSRLSWTLAQSPISFLSYTCHLLDLAICFPLCCLAHPPFPMSVFKEVGLEVSVN